MITLKKCQILAIMVATLKTADTFLRKVVIFSQILKLHLQINTKKL